MSSSYKPQVGDIVIPFCGKFEGLRCRVAVVGGHTGVECLEKAEEGHNLDGRLSKPNGWWYFAEHLRFKEKDSSSFKAGDRVSSPLYPERGPGTIRESDTKTLILVEHDEIFSEGHDGDGDCPYGTAWFYNDSDIQIAHEVKPKPEPKPESKFKVGDVVESKLDRSSRGPGVILKIQPSGIYAVEHFKHIKTHDCKGLGKDGHCWNYEEDEIILSSATKPEEPTSLNTIGGVSTGMSGTIAGSTTNPTGSTTNFISVTFDPYTSTNVRYDEGSGLWTQIEAISKSKKPKPSVDKYIQNPIISKKTKKKKSLVIV